MYDCDCGVSCHYTNAAPRGLIGRRNETVLDIWLRIVCTTFTHTQWLTQISTLPNIRYILRPLRLVAVPSHCIVSPSTADGRLFLDLQSSAHQKSHEDIGRRKVVSRIQQPSSIGTCAHPNLYATTSAHVSHTSRHDRSTLQGGKA